MMKRQFLVVMFMFTGLLFVSSANGQSRYTPYDELPMMIKSDKPVYMNSYPDWAKMLYQYPINYNEINEAFEKYEREHKGEESAIIRYYKNWKRVIVDYVNSDGTIELPDLNKLNELILNNQKRAASELKATQANNSWWTFWGPKETYWLNRSGSSTPPGSCPWQANVYSIDVAPTNDSLIWVGTETGFVNKSVDKGETWTLMGQDYPFGGVVAVAIHPTNPDIVYVSGSSQIHKTEDGGYTWVPLLPADNLFKANHIKIDPDDPSKIIATSTSGIYVTTDAGANWTKKYNAKAWDIEFKPGNTDSIFVLCSNGSDTYEMALSTDGGDSFTKMSSFPENLYEASGGLLAVTPANKDLIYVTMLAREGEDGVPYIYKGEYDGTDYIWTRTKRGVLGGGLGEFSNGQGYFDLVLDVSPNNEKVVFWGTCSLYKSTDGGYNYTKIGGYGGNYAIHPDIQGMKMLPNGDTWVTTDGGVNYTTDDFASSTNYHVKIEGLIGSDMWGFDQGWNEDIVVGGRYHNGNTAMADFYGDKALRMGGAESPTGWILRGYSRRAAFNDLGNGWILPKTAEGAPEGRFIFSKFPNMDEYGGRRSNLLHHPNYYDVLYLGEGNGFWKSTDAGVNWDLLNSFPDRVRYMQISFKNPDVIYVDVVGSGLYKTIDGGQTWERKPSLTDGTYGSPRWNGKLFFAISPYDENVIYACLSNGTWTKDIGKIYRSTNGGDTWKDWTSGLSEYMKCIVIQPTAEKRDLVYLFNTTKNGQPASVYYRKANEYSWTRFDNEFPAGMSIKIAMPFYRDSKIRCAGSAGVWETPMQEEVYTPVLNPWCQKPFYNCVEDTVYFDDHSMLNHAGASWHWEFSPEPKYVSDPNVRNPVVYFGDTISYDVTMTVTVNGQSYSKTIPEMVTFSKCPSVDDCNNPAEIPKDDWTLLYVDSYERNRPGTNAIDGDPKTIWHTEWSTVDPDTPYPHELQADMGVPYLVSKFTYLPRQDGGINGTVKEYELYLTEDKDNWGDPVLAGTFETSNTSPKTIEIDPPVAGRYFKFVGLSEVNGGAWASAAEFSFVGCHKPTAIFDNNYSDEITAFPVPTDGKVNISVLTGNMGRDMRYTVYSVCGQVVGQGMLNSYSGNYTIDMSHLSPGVYFVIMEERDGNGSKFRVKVVKE